MTETLILGTDDPWMAFSLMKGRVCAVELEGGEQVGQARDFRVERVPEGEALFCTADMIRDEAFPDDATIGGYPVTGILGKEPTDEEVAEYLRETGLESIPEARLQTRDEALPERADEPAKELQPDTSEEYPQSRDE